MTYIPSKPPRLGNGFVLISGIAAMFLVTVYCIVTDAQAATLALV